MTSEREQRESDILQQHEQHVALLSQEHACELEQFKQQIQDLLAHQHSLEKHLHNLSAAATPLTTSQSESSLQLEREVKECLLRLKLSRSKGSPGKSPPKMSRHADLRRSLHTATFDSSFGQRSLR